MLHQQIQLKQEQAAGERKGEGVGERTVGSRGGSGRERKRATQSVENRRRPTTTKNATSDDDDERVALLLSPPLFLIPSLFHTL